MHTIEVVDGALKIVKTETITQTHEETISLDTLLTRKTDLLLSLANFSDSIKSQVAELDELIDKARAAGAKTSAEQQEERIESLNESLK